MLEKLLEGSPMAKKRVESEEVEASDCEPEPGIELNDAGTTLDDGPGDWIGNPEPGAEKETEDHQFARRVLGR